MSEGGESSARSREPLNRPLIVRTAVELIDELGVREVSMRRLGRELGVEGMALYRYFPSRDSLLDAVVEAVIDELYADPDVHMLPLDGWQEYLRKLAHGVRRMALRHPQVFPLIATRPPAAPWVRPPLRSLRWVEVFLQGLLSREFTDAQAIDAYRGFSSFLLGHLLLEVSALGVDTGPVDEPDPDQLPPAQGPDLGRYPLLLRLAPSLAEDHFEGEFSASLENVLARIDPKRVTSHTTG